MPKRVLVTGGAGYIGAVLVPKLLERGYQVRVLDRLYWGTDPLKNVLGDIELVPGDVRDMKADTLHGVDAVIHLAGLSNDPTAEYNTEANWQMNAVATQRLGEACKKHGIPRLSYGSSCSIYDGLPPDSIYAEDASVEPKGAYATSKHFGEQALFALKGDGFCPVVLRQGTVYGYSPRMRFDLVVNTFVKDAYLKKKIFLHGGGWMWRPLVDVTDVAEAHIACVEAPEELVNGQVFNLLHANYQIRELAMLVAGSAQMRRLHVELEDAPLPKIVRDYRCAGAKIRDKLSFEPKVSVLESIENLLSVIESNGLADFSHPRYYNIDWMTLLEEMHPILSSYKSVF